MLMDAHANTSRMWLDHLPLDVCERIALYVSAGRQNKHALNLAFTSSKQRRAVLNIRNHKLRVHYNDRKWAELMATETKDVTVWPVSETMSYVEELLRSPRLLRAELPATPVFVQRISFATSLRRLSLNMSTMPPYGLILYALAVLNLSELRLSCSGGNCHILPLVTAGGGPEVLANCCKRLELLEICCYKHDPAPVWPIIRHFSSIKALTLNSDLPDCALPTLRALSSVRLEKSPWSHRLAISIGSPVTALTTKRCLSAPELASLTCCSRLESLDASLEDGAEEALGTLPRNLKSIHLRWNPMKVRNESGEAYPITIGIMADGSEDCVTYYSLPAFSIPRLVEMQPNIEAIGLSDVKISLVDVESILQMIGPNLRQLYISIELQDEEPQKRLIAVLEYAARYNRNLVEFEVHDTANFICSYVRMDEEMSVDEQKSFRAAYNRLTLNAPCVEVKLAACRLIISDQFYRLSEPT